MTLLAYEIQRHWDCLCRSHKISLALSKTLLPGYHQIGQCNHRYQLAYY